MVQDGEANASRNSEFELLVQMVVSTNSHVRWWDLRCRGGNCQSICPGCSRSVEAVFQPTFPGELKPVSASSGRAHIIIVGRSRTRAEEIIASFPKTTESQYDFIQCDASLLKNVVAAANEAKGKISGPLNYLVVCPGIFHFKGFAPTSEGIDIKLALHFYSRWKVGAEVLEVVQWLNRDLAVRR